MVSGHSCRQSAPAAVWHQEPVPRVCSVSSSATACPDGAHCSGGLHAPMSTCNTQRCLLHGKGYMGAASLQVLGANPVSCISVWRSKSVCSTTHVSPLCESVQCSAGAQETPRTWRRTHSWAQDQQKTQALARAVSPCAHTDVSCLLALRRLHPGVFANTKQL